MFHHRNGGAVNLHSFLHGIVRLVPLVIVFPEGPYAVDHDGTAFVFFLLAQNDVLVQGHIVVGLTVAGGASHFQVAALDHRIIRLGLLAAYRNGGMPGIYCLELGHVDGIRIEGACGHAGDLAGHGAVVAHGNGIIRSFPSRAGRAVLCIGRFFLLDSQIYVFRTGCLGVTAQSDTVSECCLRTVADGSGILCRCRAAQCGQGVLTRSGGTDAEGGCGFAGGGAVFAEGGGVVTGGSCRTAESRGLFAGSCSAETEGRGIVARSSRCRAKSCSS